MALEGLAGVLDHGAVGHLNTDGWIGRLEHLHYQLLVFLKDVVEYVLSHQPSLHVSQQRGDELSAVEDAAALRDDDEKGVVSLQKEAEDFSPREEAGLELGRTEAALGTHGLHFGQLFTGRAGLPQFVVDPNTVDSLLEGSRLVHLPWDVSLADHGQEGDELVEILVHHEPPSLLALFSRPSSAATLGRGRGGTVIVRGAGQGRGRGGGVSGRGRGEVSPLSMRHCVGSSECV